jgi:hypothetical protein
LSVKTLKITLKTPATEWYNTKRKDSTRAVIGNLFRRSSGEKKIEQ